MIKTGTQNFSLARHSQDCSKGLLVFSFIHNDVYYFHKIQPFSSIPPYNDIKINIEKGDDDISGIYQHFKGKTYRVIDIAYDYETEDLKKYVYYEQLEDSDFPKGSRWVRPYDEFFDIHSCGKKRFVKVEE